MRVEGVLGEDGRLGHGVALALTLSLSLSLLFRNRNTYTQASELREKWAKMGDLATK